MNSQQAADLVYDTYAEHADAHLAEPMQKYMKDLFPFFGIKKPHRAVLDKNLLATIIKDDEIKPFELIKLLWGRAERELHYFAIQYALKKKLYLQKEALDLFEHMILYHSWWDSVDTIADHLVGNYMLAFPELKEKEIMRFVNHPNMWMNRTAIIFQLKYKEKTDTDLLLAAILTHLDSKEFFIRKAQGWALRQYAKTDPQFVVQTVKAHRFSGLTVREALKHQN
jgi:3-methyladenine DNA glycosylase AlkD